MRAALGLALFALLGGSLGCTLWTPSSAPGRTSPPGRADALPLELSRWTRGTLHCAVGACVRWYRIELQGSGTLRIGVHAATGPNEPDFDLLLEDVQGEVLWGFAPTGVSPRRVERRLSAGVYYLLLETIGERGAPLEFEAFAEFEPSGSVLRPRTAGAARVAPRRSHGSEIWVSAEILRVEGQAGSARVVVLDAGARDELSPGQRGELLEGDRVIASFELIHVAPGRSRARLDAPPTDVIRYETRARVRVPLE